MEDFVGHEWVPDSAVAFFKRSQRPPSTDVSLGRKLEAMAFGDTYAHCEIEFLCDAAPGAPHDRDALVNNRAAGSSQTLAVTIAAANDRGIAALNKPPRHEAAWVAVPLALTPDDLVTCYDYHVAALGVPYTANVEWSVLVAWLGGCCRCADGLDETLWCSELVARSLDGTDVALTAIPRGGSTPDLVYAALTRLPDDTPMP